MNDILSRGDGMRLTPRSQVRRQGHPPGEPSRTLEATVPGLGPWIGIADEEVEDYLLAGGIFVTARRPLEAALKKGNA